MLTTRFNVNLPLKAYGMALKLLVIRFSSIGDIVLTSPVVRCLKTQLKDAEVHFLTKNKFAGIVQSNPYISKVYTINKSPSEINTELRNERYDYVIDLHNNIRSHLVKWSLLKPSHSFNKLNIEKWLMVRLKWNRLPNVHIVDRYLDTASFLGIENDGLGLDFFIPDKDEIKLINEYPQLSNGYVAFSIGGNHNTKILPADLVADVIKMLDKPVIILGGKDDMERANLITDLAGAKAINLSGKLTLMESASVVKQSHSVISNDTGLMHIAAAFQKPIVSVWGNTIPEFGMYPYLPLGTPHMIAEVNDLKCRPCSKIGYKECPLKHFNCMRMQDTRKIAGFINNLN